MKDRIIKILLYIVVSLFSCLVAFSYGIELGISLTAETYDHDIIPVLSMLGTWLAGLGSSSAVVVSLWLAYKQFSKDKEILDCQLGTHIIGGEISKLYLGLKIVSKGNKPSQIKAISWYGKSAKTSMWVKDFLPLSTPLPTVLDYGQEAFILHLEGFEKHLHDYIKEHMNGKFKNLILVVSTTTTTVKIKADQKIIDFIKKSKKS